MASMNQGGRASAGAILTKPQAHVCSGSIASLYSSAGRFPVSPRSTDMLGVQPACLKRAISEFMHRSNSSLMRCPEVESFRGPLVSRLGAICRFEIGFQVCSSPSRALASFKSSVSKPSVNQP